MNRETLVEYVHYPLNEEITAIGGHYVITEEVTLDYEGRRVFYTVGYGVMDTTCCGTGGCGYATVYGDIADWKQSQNGEGLPVSKMHPIRDEREKREIRDKVNSRETVQQVNFL